MIVEGENVDAASAGVRRCRRSPMMKRWCVMLLMIREHSDTDGFNEWSMNNSGVGPERWQQHGAIARAANDVNPTGKDV